MAEKQQLQKIKDTLETIVTQLSSILNETKPTKKAEKAEKAEKAQKVEKNLPRLTKKLSEQLKEIFDTETIEWDDKFKTKFSEYVNTQTSEQYKASTLEEHMQTFSNTMKPLIGGGGKPSEEETTPKPVEPTELTYKQLKELKGLSQTNKPGIYLTKQQKLVTGPPHLNDEDMENASINGKEYLVGDTTKRVYDEENEEFQGYWGVGQFKDSDL